MPAGTPKYFSYPFGVSGDLTTVPDPVQVGGSVSYAQGFGPDYALLNTDPAYLSIPRNQFNQLLFDVTSTLQQIYQNGFPQFITTAMNDGSAYSYSKNAYVYQPSDGNVYYSLVNSNTDVPPSVKWQIVGGPTATSYFNAATDTGSADHYVIAPTPPIGTLAAGDIVILQPTHANTGACDLNVNSGGALAIKTLQNQDPTAGMIIPTATHFLAYNATTGFWVLLNPALGTAAYLNVGTSANQVVQLTAGAVIPNGIGAVKSVKQQVFAAGTTYTPSAGMLYCIIRAAGGGASGGGYAASGGVAGGGGGGGAGEYAEGIFSATTIGASQTVTIGAGGAAGTGGNHPGNAGGATSVGSLLVANGGAGGVGGSGGVPGAGGLGGTGGTGTILINGGNGNSGAGAGGEGVGGMGGSCMGLGAGGASLGDIDANGQAGQLYGGGGSGALGTGGSGNYSGGAGAAGVVIVTEYCSQ